MPTRLPPPGFLPSAAPRFSDLPPFDAAEAVTPVGGAPCAECRGAIGETYYETDLGVLCAGCHARTESARRDGATTGGLLRPLGFGLGAAAASAGLFLAILSLVGRDVSVLAIAVGIIVGKGVRLGARGHGSRRQQWLAAALAYVAVAGTYAPFVIRAFQPSPGTMASDGAARMGILLGLAAAAPVLEGLAHPVTLCIGVVTIATAWRINRRIGTTITGPYRVRSSAVSDLTRAARQTPPSLGGV